MTRHFGKLFGKLFWHLEGFAIVTRRCTGIAVNCEKVTRSICERSPVRRWKLLLHFLGNFFLAFLGHFFLHFSGTFLRHYQDFVIVMIWFSNAVNCQKVTRPIHERSPVRRWKFAENQQANANWACQGVTWRDKEWKGVTKSDKVTSWQCLTRFNTEWQGGDAWQRNCGNPKETSSCKSGWTSDHS